MDIEETPVYKEVKDIIDGGPKKVFFYYKAQIHADGKDYDVTKVLSIKILRDYISKAADIIAVTVNIPYGLWLKTLFPFKDKLEMTITRVPISEVGDNEEEAEDPESMRFVIVPDPKQMPNSEGKDYDRLSQDFLDNLGFFDIEFQISDKVSHRLKGVTVGGIFRRTTASEITKALLAHESSKIKVEDDIAFKGVDMVEPNNETKTEHTIIRHGTKLFDLPVYAQKYLGGIYNAGIGCYYQSRYWFVYPLFDTTRFNKAKKTMVIVKVPTLRARGMERTYRQDGDTLYVIGTSESDIDDDAGTNFSNKGNGTRFADARRFMRNFAEVSGNKAKSKRSKNNHEFIVVDRDKDYEEGTNVALMSTRKINSNPYVERSKILGRKGSIFTVIWENADPFLTYPGMMCKIHYLDGEVIKELHGVLHSVQSSVDLVGKGITVMRHTVNTVLVIFANPAPDSDQVATVDDEEIPQVDWSDYEAL
jgi:hypothetical protein